MTAAVATTALAALASSQPLTSDVPTLHEWVRSLAEELQGSRAREDAARLQADHSFQMVEQRYRVLEEEHERLTEECAAKSSAASQAEAAATEAKAATAAAEAESARVKAAPPQGGGVPRAANRCDAGARARGAPRGGERGAI